jgi:hypothetical protein
MPSGSRLRACATKRGQTHTAATGPKGVWARLAQGFDVGRRVAVVQAGQVQALQGQSGCIGQRNVIGHENTSKNGL